MINDMKAKIKHLENENIAVQEAMHNEYQRIERQHQLKIEKV